MVEMPFGLSKEYSDGWAVAQVMEPEITVRPEVVARERRRYESDGLIEAGDLTSEELEKIIQPFSIRVWNFVTSVPKRLASK